MKWFSWLAVFVVAAVLAALLTTFKYSQLQAASAYAESFPETSETVVVARANAVDFRPRQRAVGEIVPPQAIDLVSEFAGLITEVNFLPGAEVVAGDILVRLDIREERAALEAAHARAELARLTVERNESLSKRSMVSEQAIDEARAERKIALAEARRLETVIDKKTLKAPFDARTGLHEWEPGQFIEAGTLITRLVGVSGFVWVDFSLPQDVAGSKLGADVKIRIPGRRARYSAAIVARQPFVDETSRAVRLRARLADAEPLPAAGAIVNVEVATGQPQRAIEVPATAVRRDLFGPHVFVLEAAEDGADAPFRARRREVEVMQIVDDTAYLNSGIDAADEVATDGAFKLRDGMLVNPARNAVGDATLLE